jgi:Asp-tRNA(Asn)/Glu-tRNA(Gln) amidotransferase A subunit family amidase
MDEALAAGELVVTPTVAALDKRIGVDTIDGTHYRVALSWFTAPVNATGFPALSVPLTGDGRTASIQLIGPPRSEPRLLEAARRLAERRLARVVGMTRQPS